MSDPLLDEQLAMEAPADRDFPVLPIEHWFHQSRPVDVYGQPLPAKNAGKVNGGPHQPANPLHRAKAA